MLQWSMSIKISSVQLEFEIVYLHLLENKQSYCMNPGWDIGSESGVAKFISLTLQDQEDWSNKSVTQINNNY